MHAAFSIIASYSCGRSHGAALVLAFMSAISCCFHLRLWTCHVPKPNVVAGMSCKKNTLIVDVTAEF